MISFLPARPQRAMSAPGGDLLPPPSLFTSPRVPPPWHPSPVLVLSSPATSVTLRDMMSSRPLSPQIPPVSG